MEGVSGKAIQGGGSWPKVERRSKGSQIFASRQGLVARGGEGDDMLEGILWEGIEEFVSELGGGDWRRKEK